MNSTPYIYEGKSNQFAIMVGNKEHFIAAILTADQLLKGTQNLTVEVVAVGDLVKDIAEDKTLFDMINQADTLEIKLTVCEIAMALNKVSRNKLDQRFNTVRNGWIHLFELKDKGYNTLSI